LTTLLGADRAALINILSDDKLAVENLFAIPPKQSFGSRVPFIFKPAQLKLHNALTLRNLTVKPSQIGSTSYYTGVFFRRTMFRPDTTSVIIAHESFLSERLLNRTELFYRSTPEQLQPRMDHSSATEKRFPDINSVMYIGTARAAVFGRGEPIHNLLLSEAAFYLPDAIDRIVKPSLQRVPIDGTVVIESTANGEGGWFYEEVQAALAGQSVFSLTVLYWWEEPDNQIPPGHQILAQHPDFQYDFTYTPDETILAEQQNLTQDQIRWRRWKVLELGDLFWQEHLESLDTCFLTVGLPYYDVTSALALSKHVSRPINQWEGAQIWEEPIPGAVYVMGVDPGQARQTESVAWVVREDEELGPVGVAMLGGLYEPDIMGAMTLPIARLYNNARIIPEVNGHGVGYLDAIKHKYSNIYIRRDLERGKPMQRYGWVSSVRTKPFMMDTINKTLKKCRIPDAETVRQIRGFRSLGFGRYETLLPDDRHDAWGLALMGLELKGNTSRGMKGTSGYTSWDN
jgi:hypothetical protein|tara:strand:- start:32381 stop:33922 length:1542 start_codon:yes stop_codon:yes gene_type:complete